MRNKWLIIESVAWKWFAGSLIGDPFLLRIGIRYVHLRITTGDDTNAKYCPLIGDKQWKTKYERASTNKKCGISFDGDADANADVVLMFIALFVDSFDCLPDSMNFPFIFCDSVSGQHYLTTYCHLMMTQNEMELRTMWCEKRDTNRAHWVIQKKNVWIRPRCWPDSSNLSTAHKFISLRWDEQWNVTQCTSAMAQTSARTIKTMNKTKIRMKSYERYSFGRWCLLLANGAAKRVFV